ncbi:MAG: hypothetical protein R3B07_02900 [Polyangiaceae bacterium]
MAVLALGGCSDDESSGGNGGSSGNGGSAGSANGGSSGNGGSAGNGGSSGSGGSSASGGTSGNGGSSGSAGASTGGSAGAATGGSAGASTGGSAGAGTGGSAGATGGTGGASCTGVELKVKNYLSWCSVSVAGEAASTAAEQTVCVPEGAVNLSATALSGFILGTAPWHNTDGDSGSGEQGTLSGSGQSRESAAVVTVSGGGTSDCVWVCCPFDNGTGCPTTDQCP